MRSELYELNLDECFYAFKTRPSKMSAEENDAFDTCIRTNRIVLGTLMPSGDCKALTQLTFFILDQGLRAKIAQEVFAANTSSTDEEIALKVETQFKEAQAPLWNTLVDLVSKQLLSDAQT